MRPKTLIITLFCILFLVSTAQAGIFDFLKKKTSKPLPSQPTIQKGERDDEALKQEVKQKSLEEEEERKQEQEQDYKDRQPDRE